MSERIEIEVPGGHKLIGQLHHPAGPARAHALFAHCFTCSKDLRAVVAIAKALAEEGIATLRFDFTGLGESEGEFADTGFSSNVQELVHVAKHLETIGEAPDILIGHSLGGAAVLAAASSLPGVKAVVTIGAPADPAHVKALLTSGEADLEEHGEAEVCIGGRPFTIRKRFIDDLERQQPHDAVRGLARPLLIFHAPKDMIVGIDNARRIYEGARHPKSFVSLDDADHLLSRSRDARYVGRVLASWVERYLPALKIDDTEEGHVVVTSGSSGLAQRVVASGHVLAADEPVSLKGTDTGPTPYDYLLAGLGACTSMTLRMYANRKQWPLRGVEVRLSHARIHARDCDDCEHESGLVNRIERSIELLGDLDDEQRARLIEIANKCPVHRTLLGQIEIHTEERRS